MVNTVWLHIGLLSVLFNIRPLEAQCNGDDDSSFGEFIQQQTGQRYSCAEIIFESGQGHVCDIGAIAGICCASCIRLVSEIRELRIRLRPVQAEVRALLHQSAERLLSPPLHGKGSRMPLIAVGTGGLKGKSGQDLMQFALESGLVHLDSALMYDNHAEVRGAVESSGVRREDVFITTKVPPEEMGYSRSTKALRKIKEEMSGGFADLCLVHWPKTDHWREDKPAGASESRPPPQWSIVERSGTWRAFEEAYADGVCKAIGVSNYLVKHLEELRSFAKVPPSVNQLEFSPLAPIQDVREYCRANQIILQAFSWRNREVLESSGVQSVAAELGRSPTQIVQHWFLQQGMTPLFMTAKYDRLLNTAKDLAEEFKMSEAQLNMITQPMASYEDYPWKHYQGDSRVWLWPTMTVDIFVPPTHHDCFAGTDFSEELCCGKQHGPSGNALCWDAEYTFERCCQQR